MRILPCSTGIFYNFVVCIWDIHEAFYDFTPYTPVHDYVVCVCSDASTIGEFGVEPYSDWVGLQWVSAVLKFGHGYFSVSEYDSCNLVAWNC